MADFSIQRGSIIIDSTTTGTITAGVDYTAPASIGSAFIRIVGLNNNSSGDNTSDFNGQPQRNNHVVSNPSNLLTSIAFIRNLAGTIAVEVFYEIIEYVGAFGGDHEFIVRHEESIAFTGAGSTTIDSSTFGSVATAADVLVFHTGMHVGEATRSDGGAGRFTWEYVGGSTLARGTRINLNSSGEASVAVVEFTGSAWAVQRIDHTFTASATNETETITSVGSLARAFTHYQSRYDSTTTGADGLGFEAYLSDTTTLTLNATQIDSGMAVTAWIVNNTQTTTGAMDVERISGSRADNAGGGTDPDSWTEIHSSGASDITTISVLGETGTSDKTVDAHLIAMGFGVNSKTVIDLLRGRDEGNRTYRFEVVSWPEEAVGGATNPKGPFTHPFFGPFRGPIS